jgi:tetratricopeptide (TPR) repeat protein
LWERVLTKSSGGRLGQAHQGYIDQDQATSYFLLASLLERFDEVTVDRKEVDDDRFDDLAVRHGSRYVRRQFKSSDDPSLTFKLADLATKTNRNLTVDALVRSYTRAGAAAADEYRLCATWRAPTDPKELGLLDPVAVEPSFQGHPSKTFRLRAETIWPDGGAPIWRSLQRAPDISRDEFLEFARRFVIELECPLASRDFSKPGQIEALILNLLTGSVGIGRYPNQHRSSVEVAARLQQFAARARSLGQTVTPADVEHELQLQKDFGRVEQQFPVVAATVVRREHLRREIKARVGGRRVIVEGPPGSGKSWELTGVAEDLKSAGYTVARHYCYLEPGDPEVQRRITTDVMFANLIYELIQANPGLERLHRPAYSAGPRELEDLLRKGVDSGLIGRAALIVDGIDHVSRVFAESTGVAREEVDIVEELAALNLPEEVCLIVGSQPGEHLNPLRYGAANITMPAWRFGEVAALASRLGIPGALRNSGLGGSVKEFLEELHGRSEGNPLYATFLCRQTLERIATGGAVDPVADLRDAPLTGGDISVYYDYLLRGAEAGGVTGPVAELLGLIDFAVTEDELAEILAPFAHRLRPAVSHLAPILAPARSRGGLRIYHESFRRFVNGRLRDRGGSVEAVLSPAIDWLRRRDFFEDARAYRFLLPTLRRAGRRRELLELVGADFVSRSVEAGHSKEAVEHNLAVATYAAAEELDWAALTRCVELYKASTICFGEKLIDYDLYGRAFAAVRGPAALAERMLFDGRPTFGADQGLVFCSLCDDAGVIPPWEQYLDLAAKQVEDDNRVRDPNRVDYAIARSHGQIQLYGVEAFYARVVSWLGRVTNPDPKYLRGILKRMVRPGGAAVLRRLLSEATPSAEAAGFIRIELAHALAAEGESEEAARVATEAVAGSESTSLAAEGLALGADKTEVSKRIPPLDDKEAGLGEECGHPDAAAVRQWVDGVKIAAATDPAHLATAEGNIRGEGWYKNWLRFVIALARAEEMAEADPDGAEAAALAVVRDLASDTAPFKGNPRACDLYSVREIIHETISRALRLIRRAANFEEALARLAEIARGATSYLSNSPNGPLTPKAFIELLLPFVRDPGVRKSALAEMSRQLRRIKEGGDLYDTAADADLLFTRALSEAGDAPAAEQSWRSASIYLCAYGYRGDSSIFDLFEGAAALGKIDVARATRALALTQPLVNAASDHTDGKVTRHAPASWVGAVAEVNVVAGAYVLGRSLVRYGGAIDWRYEDALEEVIDAARRQCDPALAAFLDATFPFAGSAEDVEKKLSTIGRLATHNAGLAGRLLRVLASKTNSAEAYERILRFAGELGITLPSSRTVAEEAKEDKPASVSRPDHLEKFRDNPLFPEKANPLGIMTSIKETRRSMNEADAWQDRLVNAFGYRLVDLLNSGDEEGAIRLLKVFARETHFWAGAAALADLGEGLERHGHTRAAAVAFSLAYARSRGGGGYQFLGDEKHLPWLLRAAGLSREIASRSLAEEIAFLLSHHGYYLGITRHQIEALASQPETRDAAFEAWQAAYEVLRHRLPGNEDDHYVFEKYDPSSIPTWSPYEALVYLLLARMCHPEVGRKVTAAAGFAHAVMDSPSDVGGPLREFLRVDAPVTSTLLVLQTLLSVEAAPYEVTRQIQEELQGLYHSGLFGLRAAAQMLLDRAGLTPLGGRTDVSAGADPPPPQKMEAYLSLDLGERVEIVGRLWPQFPGIVAGVFHRVWEGTEAHKDRGNSRHKAARSRVYNGLPPARLLFWELELFETIFNEVLEGVDAHLWRTGEWHPDIPIWLLSVVLPRLPLHVGRLYSRVPRPPLPLPSEQHPGVDATTPLPDDDEFAGWYRCGYFEREIVTERMHRVTDTVMVMESVQFPNALGNADSTLIPLASGKAETWLEPQQDSRAALLGLRGPVAGLDLVRDWMGGPPILMLQPYIQSRLGLSPGDPWRGRLELVDRSGEVAVIFRCWEERPVGDSVGEEAGRLQGCDLIVRPDVFSRMTAMAGLDPVSVTYITRGADDEEDEENNASAADVAADAGQGVILVES